MSDQLMRAILRNQGRLAGMIQTAAIHTLHGNGPEVLRCITTLEKSSVAIQKEIVDNHPQGEPNGEAKPGPRAVP